jgi:hypothetical protein
MFAFTAQGALNNWVSVNPVEFIAQGPRTARQVSIIGDWDNWTYKLPLSLDMETGLWRNYAHITPGHYHFEHVVDEWGKFGRASRRGLNHRQRVNYAVSNITMLWACSTMSCMRCALLNTLPAQLGHVSHLISVRSPLCAGLGCSAAPVPRVLPNRMAPRHPALSACAR